MSARNVTAADGVTPLPAVYMLILERQGGGLGVVRNRGESNQSYCARVFDCARALALLAADYAAKLEPTDDETTAIVVAGVDLARALEVFAKPTEPVAVTPAGKAVPS